jgi:3',5'-cyclic AMP phosphodiesterase CpdA
MIRLAHLSDIHLTAPKLEWRAADWFNKRFAAWFNFRVLGRRFRFRHADEVMATLIAELNALRPDRIIFSGDATALGFESELQRAADYLGVANSSFSGLAVPGNHDYCTRPAAASGNFERIFASWQKGERVDGERYPFAQKIGDAWLIGVNSCTGNRWAWDAAGSVGSPQLERLERLLGSLSGGPRMLVTHYPICLADGRPERKTHGLRDLADLIAVAAKGGVSLWLHGHRHHFYFTAAGNPAPFPVICVGSATQTGCWSYGQYTLEGSRFHVQRRIYDPEQNQFRDEAAFDVQLKV